MVDQWAEANIAKLVGDDAADTLMEYASALANADISDSVTLSAIDDHGNAVDATFLLTPSTNLLVETSTSDMAEPENEAVVDLMLQRISTLLDPPPITPEDPALHDGGPDYPTLS